MKIIIFEGIAASGKTSVIGELVKFFEERKAAFSVISETETLLPLLDNTDKNKSVGFLKGILKKTVDRKKDYIVFDRLYFTHMFRTKCAARDFGEIENLIRSDALLILLTIDENKIGTRIKKAREYRDSAWNEYVDKKGSEEEITNYYVGQQRLLLNITENCPLEHTIYDATNNDFKGIAKKILDHLKNDLCN